MVSPVPEKTAPGGKKNRAPSVLLLPSHLFFVRSLSLPAGISPEELPSFVELSLEEISPFAINQLYYGYHLPAGGSRLLVFAAYRKQLAGYESDEAWISADLVLPDFTAALGISRKGPTVVFVQDEHEVSAIYWSGDEQTPDRVLSRHVEAVDGKVPFQQAREELLRKIGPLPGNVATLVLENPAGNIRDRNLVFNLQQQGKAEPVSAEIARSASLPMDVRDKTFLLATRRTQRQNRWLWAGVMMACAGFLALGVFEAALFGGRYILNTREAEIRALEPEVAKIRQEEDLANRLAELSGERLLPFEMLAHLESYRPPSIYYTRAIVNGVRSFEIEARTPRSQDVDRFQRLLEGERLLENVEIGNLRLRAQDGLSSFTFTGNFRKGALTAFASSPRQPAERERAPEESAAEETEAAEEADDETGTVSVPERPVAAPPDGAIEPPVRNARPEQAGPGPRSLPETRAERGRGGRPDVRAPLPPPPPPAEEEEEAAPNEEEEI